MKGMVWVQCLFVLLKKVSFVAKILLLSQFPAYIPQMSSILTEAGHKLQTLTEPSEDSLAIIKETHPDLVVFDLGMLSTYYLRILRKSYPDIPSVVILDEGSQFMANLATPRVQYLSGEHRFGKLLLVVDYALAGKSTMDRIRDTQKPK